MIAAGRCRHPVSAHQHYRRGKDCGLCDCSGKRTVGVRRLLAMVAAGAVLAATGLAWARQADASPGQCGGGGFIGGGSFCDSDPWADGSFQHCVTGWGPFAWGSQCMRVCDNGTPLPPVTDNDPSTPC